MDAKDLKIMAHGRWAEILAALAPSLRPALERAPRHVPCPVHGGKDGFRFFRDFRETGAGICNTCGPITDGFAALMWANGWDFATAARAVRDYLTTGARLAANTRTAAQDKQPQDDETRRRRLNEVWRGSLDLEHPKAEPARLYLARRGIVKPAPAALRFHPALPYHEGDKKVGEYPAIVALVSAADGRPATLHRTYITQGGAKAPVDSPKKLMSYPSDRVLTGGAIRLSEPAEALAVAEGLETALSVLLATGIPTWCAVNAHLMENFVPPACVRRVLVFADKDRPTAQHPDGHGQEAARALVKRLWSMGIQASAIVPAGEIPSGRKSLDWNDVLVRDGPQAFPTWRSVEALLRRAA